MSSGSPSPRPDGGRGWSTPSLTPHSGRSTPRSSELLTPASVSSNISWASAKAKSEEIRGYPSFATRNNGFFSRSKRQISATLPRWRSPSGYDDYAEKDEKGAYPYYGGAPRRGCSPFGSGRSVLRRKRMRLVVVLLLGLVGYLYLWSAIVERYRRSPFGNGRKFVIVLESNIEGGVMELKGAREWAVERNSIANKAAYAQRWGYDLEIVNMLAKKRYSHEWREGWEKVDILRETMGKYPHAEWFWWIDLNTWVMEGSYSLQDHLFDRLSDITYRDINVYNPLNISHPPTEPYLDEVSRSATGDGDVSSINMVLTQDCGGFNLGSFFLRRSLWSERLLDSWWDPILYEQKHMQWEHKEQDALENLYISQPWVRSSTAFLPQRYANAFPPGACGAGGDPEVHYSEAERDFVVNMAGCKFGRDCWAEMHEYRELSKELNRTWWELVMPSSYTRRTTRAALNPPTLDLTLTSPYLKPKNKGRRKNERKMPTPESAAFLAKKPTVAPTYDGVDFEDNVAVHNARDAIIREQWVRSMMSRLVGEELGKCYHREGVNHMEKCGVLREKYFELLSERKIKGYLGQEKNVFEKA
ncbi:putative alpha-1,6-mannosyltransferase subunit [Aspergillus candidus]|uniref:Galactosyl transferase GMA12/MNN10 family-domain-containing protein n=1 Tax=Aspergillus candidus TaxID=41067 RepID=A0A2I2EY03_ASPCN|nr:galactosyl transferase GMA12/MNN10 family-domain-containing protein [Aspergillus candidus]PLB33252.1 galactosyl transferase GMA12/MNN10 family-domain-containing protein [Aspergillus candidus]